MRFYSKMRREAPNEGAPAAANPAPVAADPGPDLSFIPSDYHVDGKPDLGKFSTSYQEMVARDAQRAEADAAAAALIPEGDYDFTIPDGMTFDGLDLPEGFKVDLLMDDEQMKPLFADLSGILKELKAPQDAAGKLLGLLAKHQATQYSRSIKENQQAINERLADFSKLGTPGQIEARTATVSRVLDARLPADEASALRDMTTSAKALQALERLISPARATSPTPTPPGAGNEGLSAYDRLKHANARG